MLKASQEIDRGYLVKIRPKTSWIKINFKELWEFREVFYLLVWRDLRVRYKQTLLGVFWAVLQPALATLIFTAIFSRLARFETGDIPYALFALSGFTFWMFVNTSVTQASISLIYHKQLVTKIYFPRMIVPAAPIGAAFIDLLLTMIILLGAVIIAGPGLTLKALLIPFFLVAILLITLSVSLLLAAFNVRFRDVKFIVPFFLQVWMFASPVFYPSDWLPEYVRPIFALNPVTGCIDGFRHILFGTPLDWSTLSISIASAIVVIILSLIVFRKLEDDFADLL